MNVDLHSLFASRSIGKARSFLSRGGGGGKGGGGGGMSRSPGGNGGMAGVGVVSEVNRRDAMGRTVLHLAASEVGEWAVEWVEMLLRVQGVLVNGLDVESGWSALHRALYAGNLAAARFLLAREDIDARIKDHEGLSAFDVYNSTVEGTNPSDTLSSSNPGRQELFTWGSNRNFVLGFAGDGDRAFPDRVQLKREEGGVGLAEFEPLRVKDISMARLHTGIVTDEAKNNVRLCGYGTGGRLGQTSQTQFTFAPLHDFPFQASSIVLSPDHTVVVTTTGDVYTFGLNRFSQLGYTIDAPASTQTKSSHEEPIQSTPKRVVGALKKETVLGAACSRTHTAVYTVDSLFTWGTNKGQLGYGTPGTSVQVQPRKVTAVQQPVIMLTATENATACLLESKDVLVLYHEGYLRIAFPLARFPSKMQTYRPPQVSAKPNIIKIASCGNTFAALSSLGDVFTFSLESSSTSSPDSSSSLLRTAPKPLRIWSIRRKFTAVTDVGVGLDGTIILCTVSGHVFVRTKKYEASSIGKSGTTSAPPSRSGGWKFSRVPYLQRCTKVAANSTGAFAAIRSDVPLRHVDIEGSTLAENLLAILPHWRKIGPLGAKIGSRRTVVQEESDDEEAEYDARIERDVEVLLRLLKVLEKWDASWEGSAAGSDAVLVAGGKSIPVHRLLLAVRSPILAQHLSSPDEEPPDLGCTDLSALLLLHYLYSDDLPPVWDTRVGMRLRELHPQLKLDVGLIKTELKELAARFQLEALTRSLDLHVRTSPSPTLALDIGQLLPPSSLESISLPSDIVLELVDRDVHCHSVVLRARCSFFETFYEDVDWTVLRLGGEGEELRFDLKHISWDVLALVLEHIYCDAGIELFDKIERPTADEYIDFVTQVMGAANELLLDKLKLVCSAVLRTFITLHNVCSILVDAAFYEADDLSRACMHFIASSMETVLEGRLLDDLPPDLLAAVSAFCQERQGARMPISRSGMLVQDLMIKHAGWLADLDVGWSTGAARKWRAVTPRSPAPSPFLLSPGSSPQLLPRTSPHLRPHDPPNLSPALQPLREMDEPFAMDEDFSLDAGRPSPAGTPSLPQTCKASTPLSYSPSTSSFMPLGSPPPSRLQPWSKPAPALVNAPFDLRSIMATEAASERRPRPSSSLQRLDSRPSSSPPPTPTPPLWRPTTATWRAADSTRTSLASIQSEQATIAARAARVDPPRSLPRQAPTVSPAPSTPARLSNPASAVGSPVITPSRISGSRTASGSRPPKASFGAADVPWTNYNIAPSSPVLDPFTTYASSSPSTAAPSFSFASIQSQQRAEVDAIKETKAPRSFAEVMAQEAADAAAKAEEEEFARWWEAEIRRVAAEEAALGAGPAETSKKGGKAQGGGRGGKAKRGGGASRGGAQASGLSSPSRGGSSSPSRGGSSSPARSAGVRGGRGKGGGGGAAKVDVAA